MVWKKAQSNLKVSGSTTYTWIPNERRTKLDLKSRKIIIIGYNNNHKACRLVDIDIDTTSFSRDVVVNEEVGPFHASPAFQITEQLVVATVTSVKPLEAPLKGGKIMSMRSLLGW